jgi:hypothetical protein
MATMMKIKARWSGFSGAPGYSVFYFRDFASSGWTPTQATAAAAKVRTFFDSFKLFLPAVVTVTVEPDVEIIEETTGELTDVLTATVGAAITGLASPTEKYAAPVGAVVSWRTATVKNGRRIRGRTFLVPLSSGAFDTNGTLTSSAQTTISAAALALRDATSDADLGIWARPAPGGLGGGEWAVVASHAVPDMGAVLRSRRD